jgi:phosphatidylserine decarboxylase
LAAVFTIATLYALWFFRNLERIPDERDRLVFIAPIDGEIASIESAGEGARITIKTGFFDARLIRSPVQSVAVFSSVSHGIEGAEGYLKHRESLILGEKVSLTLFPNCKSSRFYNFKNGSYLGERLGFFYGGEVALALPKESEIKVAVGAKVKAGETALGFARS